MWGRRTGKENTVAMRSIYTRLLVVSNIDSADPVLAVALKDAEIAT